jgi:general secretion pathway protein B
MEDEVPASDQASEEFEPPPPPAPPAGKASPGKPAAERPVPQALTQQAPLRRFREMPPEYRADFPALDIQVHVFERAAQQRFVIINGHRYREGERMAEGPALIEIVKEGLVVEYRGEKVLYTLNR